MKRLASYIIYTILLACIVCACSDHIDIKQDYEFRVTHLPVPKKLKVGQTAEIRCQLEGFGRYENTRYYLRFFQSDGYGTLRIGDNEPFLPNDLYELEEETFRLYYTSDSEEQQVINLVFVNSSGFEFPLSFTFNHDNSGEE